MAQSAASGPFNAPMRGIAGFVGDQNQAFQQYRDAQGMAQPYYNTAANYAQESANPITGQDVNQYLNPYADYVLNNLHETQGQQMGDLTGRLRQQAGGTNADRIAVGQSELARQQNIAEGQTLAGIYQPALQAAQQQKQMAAGAGNAFANYGTGAQNAYLQGTGALNQAGNQQQGLNQSGLDAQYQYDLAKAAYPYQNAQFLANITGGLSGAMGGTTAKTSPGPSWLSQAVGAGTAIAGVGGEMGWWGGGSGSGGGSPYGNMATGLNANGAPNQLGTYAARGGRIGMADGGSVGGGGQSPYPDWMQANSFIPMQSPVMSKSGAPKMEEEKAGGSGGGFGDIMSTAMKFLPMFLSAGGSVSASPYPQNFSQGGPYRGPQLRPASPKQLEAPDMRPADFRQQWQSVRDAVDDGSWDPVGKNYNPRAFSNKNYADGGAFPDDKSGWKPGTPPDVTGQFESRWPYDEETMTPYGPPSVPEVLASRYPSPSEEMPVGDDPRGTIPDPGLQKVDSAAVGAWRQGADQDLAGTTPPTEAQDDGTKPYPLTPPAATPDGAPTDVSAQSAGNPYTTKDLPYPDLDHAKDTSRQWGKSPWMALINAGLATMGGDSPFAGVNIGKGFQQGVKTLQDQRKESREEESTNMRAKQLMLEAKKHLDQYSKMTPYQQGQLKISENSAKRQERQDRIAQQRADANDRLVAINERRIATVEKKAQEEKPDKVQDQVDAARLKALNAASDAAEKSLASLDNLEREYNNTKIFKGPVMGAIGNATGINSAAVAEVNQAALNANTQLKGSTSNNDITLLKESTPNMTMGDENFLTSVNIRRAMQSRVTQKNEFMQQYRAANGSLTGADAAWRKFMHENEISMADPKNKKKRIFNPNYSSNFAGYISGKSRAERYTELTKSGAARDEAFAKMQEEGY